MKLTQATNQDIKKMADILGYDLTDEDCEKMRRTSSDPRETVEQAVDDFLNAYER